jgi:hypothetical protein
MKSMTCYNIEQKTFLAIGKISHSLKEEFEEREENMLSIRDCLDYCDLTDGEVRLIAEYGGIPEVSAAQVLCGLVQSDEGVALLAHWLNELIESADARGLVEKAAAARLEFEHFTAAHPLPH